jgi:hypothetical protein
MEITMMTSFCAACNLRSLMQRPGCPEVLKRCMKIVEENLGQDVRGTLMSDIHTLQGDLNDHLPACKKLVTLDDDVHLALTSLPQSEESIPGKYVYNHASCNIGGLEYATEMASESNASSFFQSAGSQETVAGVIRQIFSLPKPASGLDVFIAVHRYLPRHNLQHDPFEPYPDFGASVWSRQTHERVEIIRTTQVISHAWRREWDKDNNVLKIMNKVNTIPQYELRPN